MNRPPATHFKRLHKGRYGSKGAEMVPGKDKGLCGYVGSFSEDPHQVTCGQCRLNQQFIHYLAGWDARASEGAS